MRNTSKQAAGRTFPRFARHVAVLTAFFALVALPAAHAAPPTADDQSDLWWYPPESGWGVQLVHRADQMFATMFIFDAAGKTTWAVAALQQGAPWSGDLYTGVGPFYGGAWNSANLTPRKVGTMTWSPAPDNAHGTLVYTFDGVTVTKPLTRQSIAVPDYSGSYYGALSYTNNCTGTHENVVDVTVTQVLPNVSLNWTTRGTPDSCSFAGTLFQQGRVGRIAGNFQCAPIHDDGSFVVTDLVVTPYALTGRYTSSDGDTGCASTGYITVARHR